MIENILIELGVITVVALIVSGIMAALKQPLLVGYIIAGILLGPYFFDITKSTDVISTFSKIGVIFLLFFVGLGLNPQIIKKIGKVSVVTGVGQVLFTSLGGAFIALALGFNLVTSVYIAIALAFSSTIIIMKIVSDKDDLDSVYGRIAIGFLIVQDIIVMVLLLVTASFAETDLPAGILLGFIVLKALFSAATLFLVGRYILPKVMSFAARSQEYLLLFSIGWCFIVAIFFHQLDFSKEVGGLLAGIMLANSPYRFEIAAKLRPLRDFFIFMFFIYLGSQMVFDDISQFVVPIIVFSFFVLIGNPIIIMILMGLLGYTKKNSFLAGLTVAQISEFSLIYIAMGISVGHIGKEILPLVTIVGLITIAGSTYLMMYSDRVYLVLSKYLTIFERKGKKVDELRFHEGNEFDVVLFGYNRMGKNIEKALKKMKSNYLVVDYNPEVISSLSKKGVECRYGDAGDLELLNELSLCKSQMIISTVNDFDTNSLLIKKVREKSQQVIIILVSNQEEEAVELYRKGSTYVILPHHLGGHHAAMMIEEFRFDIERFLKEKEKHSRQLLKNEKASHAKD